MADPVSANDSTDSNSYEVVLLGGGTGGYVAAIRAKQLGFRVAVVEMEKLGGTCLHRGCIPTKAMLKSADVFDTVKRAKEFGINTTGDIEFVYETALQRSMKVVDGQYKGLQYLFDKKHKIPVFHARGTILGPNTVGVEPVDGGAPFQLQATNIVINTGSRPRPIKGVPYDGERVINSDHAVVLPHLPKSFIIRGGGATGVEWASIYHRYGSKVTLVGRVVPQEDVEVSEALAKSYQRAKLEVINDARPTADDFDVTASGVTMRTKDAKGKEKVTQAEVLLVAVGRQGNVENIGLETVGIDKDPSGEYIPVNPMMQTSVTNIYAICDITGQQLLANTSMQMGIIAV